MGKSVFLPFPVLEVACIPWLVGPSSIFKTRSIASLNFSLSSAPIITTFLTLTLLPLFYKDLCGYIESTQIIEGKLYISRFITLITFAQFLLPCKVAYSWGPSQHVDTFVKSFFRLLHSQSLYQFKLQSQPYRMCVHIFETLPM